MKRGRNHLRRATAAALLIALVAGFSPPAAAQGRDDVENAIRRTDELLEEAARIVRESDSQRAREILEQAFRVQQSAKNQFGSGHALIAGRLTMEAREIGRRAVTIAREDFSLRNRAERELEKAWRMLQHAREETDGSVDGQVGRLLAEAQAQIERGRQQFGEQHYEAALRLALSAQRLIRQALGAGAGPGGAERILRELERTDRLLERAEDVIRESGDEQAMRLLGRAEGLQEDAWQAYREDRFRVALAATREARGLAARALNLVQGPTDPQRVEKALQETDRLLARAAEIVRESGNEQAARVLERARDHQAQAWRLFRDDQLRAALAKTRVAAGLAKRAIRMAEDGGAS